MSTRNAFFSDESSEKQLMIVERGAEQGVDGDRAGNRRCGASALAAGEWQSFFDAKRDADSRRLRAAQHFDRGDAGRVLARIAGEVGMTRLVDSNSAAVDRGCFDKIAGARDGTPEDVDARAQIPNSARRKRAKDVLCGSGPSRAGESAGGMGCHRR